MSEITLEDVVKEVSTIKEQLVATTQENKSLKENKEQVDTNLELKAAITEAIEGMDEKAKARFNSVLQASRNPTLKGMSIETPKTAEPEPDHELKAQLDYFTEIHAAPKIDRMLNARKLSGVSEEGIEALRNELKDKNILEINKLYEAELPLITKVEGYEVYNPALENHDLPQESMVIHGGNN